MLEWLLDLPWPVLGILVVGAFVATALLGDSLIRALILPRLGPIGRQSEATSAILHGVLIVYGLVAALIAVAVWETYNEVSKIVSSEATAIGSLYRDTAGYPEPTRTQLRDGIRVYTEQIIHEAWPLQRQGKIPTAGVELMNRVQETLFAFNPQSEAQRLTHAETLHAYNQLIVARRLRLDAVHSGLPAPMWATVLFGALITIVASIFFDVGSIPLHRIMVGLQASLIGLVIFLIVVYDHPFRGSHSVTPEAYELIHDQLMKR